MPRHVPNYTIPSDNRELQRDYSKAETGYDYTIPSDNRELQQMKKKYIYHSNYTIPSDNRELQHGKATPSANLNYTIPSDNRELQQSRYQDHILAIIPYQVIMRKIRKVYWNYGKTVINLYTTTKNRKPCKSKFPVFNRRARDGTRTRGPDLGKVVLHQLSHSRICKLFCICLPDTFDIILWEK